MQVSECMLLLSFRLQEHMLECALLDTDAALHTALAALELASSVAAHGLQEAADRALGFAEQALQKTIEKLATTQTLVLEKVHHFEAAGLKLPDTAAHVASKIAATAAAPATGSTQGHEEMPASCGYPMQEMDSWSSADSTCAGCLE